jgi:type III restriction enzyme
VQRHPRIEKLGLPPIDFYQLQIKYETVMAEDNPLTEKRLNDLLTNIEIYKAHAVIKTRELTGGVQRRSMVEPIEGTTLARFDLWLTEIARESFATLTVRQLQPHSGILEKIFAAITVGRDNLRTFDQLFEQEPIRSQIRLAFTPKRALKTRQEVVSQKAELLLASKLDAVVKNDKLYPAKADVKTILNADQNNKTALDFERELKAVMEILRSQFGDDSPLANMSLPGLSLAVKSKDQTFHYLPYDFKASGFEKDFLEQCLTLDVFQDKKLEIYYNGERGLTEFVIECYAQDNGFWKRVGKYTTDFLLLQRDEHGSIYKILLVETKGSGYENDKAFLKKKHFVETEFLYLNKEKFGYNRFDFLFLRDDDLTEQNLTLLSEKIKAFFS